MVLKIRHLVLILLLAMLFSGVASGADVQILDWITIKEKYPSLSDLGHYWIEMLDENGNVESYGWYPSASAESSPLGLGYVIGAPGVLNGWTEGAAKMDPSLLKHDQAEGQPADKEYHPILTNSLTKQEIRDKIRNFAKSYGGDWKLVSRSCHTFLSDLMKSVGLEKPASGWFISTAYAPSDEAGVPQSLPNSDMLSGESNEGSYVSPTTTTTTTRTRVAWTLPGYERVAPGSVSWLPDHYEWARNLNEGEYYSQEGNNYLKTEQYIGIYDHLPYQIVHVAGSPFSGSPSIWPPWGEDWVVTSQVSPVAGVGLLIDEGPNGGGGW